MPHQAGARRNRGSRVSIVRGMAVGRKRYCRRCGERIGRAVARCHYCGARMLPARYYAAALLALLALAALYYLAR